MGKFLFDFTDGDPLFTLSEHMAMDCSGNMMMRLGDNMAMDMSSGNLHFVTPWKSGDEDEDEW